jgi:hypothetical protein
MTSERPNPKRFEPRPKGRTIAARIPAEVAAALDAYIASCNPSPPPRDAVRYILRDWLIGQGFLKHRDDPEAANRR